MQDMRDDVVSINLPLVHTPHRGVSAAFQSAHHESSLPVPPTLRGRGLLRHDVGRLSTTVPVTPSTYSWSASAYSSKAASIEAFAEGG